MEKIKIRTVHDVISELDAKHILAVTQRVDTEPGYEDGAKVERPKLRTQEAIFQSTLAGTGIRLELVLGEDFDAAPENFLRKGPFDLAVLMGEVTSQSIRRAKQMLNKGPLCIEITKETVQNSRELKIVEASAKMHGTPELLRELVYLSTSPSARKYVDFDIPPPVEPAQTVVVKKRRRSPEAKLLETASDLSEPQRVKSQTMRVIRDTKAARDLKVLYGCECQVCGTVIEISEDQRYAEVHHIRPLGGVHEGKDKTDNMLVLCPNHHAMFDLRLPRFVNADTVEIAGQKFPLKLSHTLALSVIDYHNTVLCSQRQQNQSAEW